MASSLLSIFFNNKVDFGIGIRKNKTSQLFRFVSRPLKTATKNDFHR